MTDTDTSTPRSPFIDIPKVGTRIGSSAMKRKNFHPSVSSSNLSMLDSAFASMSPTGGSIPPLKEMRVTQLHFGKSPVSINSMDSLRTSPIPSFSFEAPARINCSPKACMSRPRAFTLPENCELDSFVQLEAVHDHLRGTDLFGLVARADQGMKFGVEPVMADGAMGGTYFLRDRSRTMCLVCKPGDEEPNSPNNPHQFASTPGPWGASYKGRVMPGFGMYREVAAYELDEGFAGVPPTQLARIRHNSLRKLDTQPNEEWSSGGYKICSVQSYVKHECSAEDMGPSMFDPEDVMRIAIFDMRMCNLDRHEGNILLCGAHPYQGMSGLTQFRNARLQVRSGSCDVDQRDWNNTFKMNADTCGGNALETNCENADANVTFSESGSTVQYSSSAPSSINPWTLKQKYAQSTVSLLCGAEEDADIMPPPPPLINYFSPASMVRSKQSTSSSATRKYRLVPIDHGYVLPHVLHLSETSFAWLHWNQVKCPVPDNLRRYIAGLDVKADVEKLRKTVGAALPETSLLTLKVCTMLLQKGVAAGVSLYDIASKAMCTGFADSFIGPQSIAARESAENMAGQHVQIRSALQIAVDEAIKMTIAQEQYHMYKRLCFRPSDLPRLTGALCSASSLPTQEAAWHSSIDPTGAKCDYDETHRKEIQVLMSQVPVNEETLFKAMTFDEGRTFDAHMEAAIHALVARLLSARNDSA